MPPWAKYSVEHDGYSIEMEKAKRLLTQAIFQGVESVSKVFAFGIVRSSVVQQFLAGGRLPIE